MNWNSTQQSRLSVEKDLLDSKLNGVTWLDPTVAGKTRVEWQMRTNNKQNFTLRVYLSDRFPNECPKLVVSSSPYGSPLKKMGKGGPLMNGTSLNDHTHQAYDGCTQICHFIPSKWSNVNTLYQVLMKGRIWLEAYELRRISGGNLDQYVAHFE